MSERKNPPALKYGAYSSLTVLPTEDPAQFENLHQDLIAKYMPNGAAESAVVRQLAFYIFRQQNIPTFHRAQRARDHARALRGDAADVLAECLVDPDSLKTRRAEQRTADKRARKDLGDAYGLIEVGDVATYEGLERELAIHAKFDDLIDRCIRRLLYLKGLASVSPAHTSPPRRQLEATAVSSATN